MLANFELLSTWIHDDIQFQRQSKEKFVFESETLAVIETEWEATKMKLECSLGMYCVVHTCCRDSRLSGSF